MSSRTPIQVPEELKQDIDGLKEEIRVKTQYDTIQWLLDYYRRNEELEVQRHHQEQEQKARIEEEYIHLGAECKGRFVEFKERMGLKRDDAVIDLLQDHWESSLEINQAVMMTYITDYSKRR